MALARLKFLINPLAGGARNPGMISDPKRNVYTLTDSASDESDTDENDVQIPAPQTENGWLKESISEIKSLLSQKVDRNEKCLGEIQNTYTR